MNKIFKDKLTSFGILYILIGIIFAFSYALFYHWGVLAFFSPGFYLVVLSWPFQLPGFVYDFQTYGFAGKVI